MPAYEVSALILLVQHQSVGYLGAYARCEWCGKLMVIKTKMGLGHLQSEHSRARHKAQL